MDSVQLLSKLAEVQNHRAGLARDMAVTDAEIAQVFLALKKAKKQEVQKDMDEKAQAAEAQKEEAQAAEAQVARKKRRMTKKMASSSSGSSSGGSCSGEEEEAPEVVGAVGSSSSGQGDGVGAEGGRAGGGAAEGEGAEGGRAGGGAAEGEGAEGEGAEGEGAGGGGAAGAAAAEHVLLTRELFAGFSRFKDMPSGSCSACWRREHPPANQGTHLRIEGRCLLFGVVSVRGRPKKAI